MTQPVAIFEQLETRRLLSAAISVKDGTLLLRGSSRNDEILVDSIPANRTASGVAEIHLVLNGRHRTLLAANVKRIRVETGAGDDAVVLGTDDFAIGDVAAFHNTVPATLLGGAGNDRLIGGDGNDSISGGAGLDSISGGAGNDTLQGDAGADQLLAGMGKDSLHAGRGDDRLAFDDLDRADGGDGTDLFSRSMTTPGIINLEPDPRLVKHVEGVIEPTTPFDRAIPQFVRIDGDTLFVEGTHRADIITVFHDYNTDASVRVAVNGRVISHIPVTGIKRIRVVGGMGDDQIYVGPETREAMLFIPEFVPVSIPLELYGNEGDDTLTGADGPDTLAGGEGNDELAGGDGNDVLRGGPGRDTVRGNAGVDSFPDADPDDIVTR